MADITVNITDGVVNVSQQGFGIPGIFSEEQQYKVLKIGTGKSQIVVRSKNRGGDASVEIVQSGSSVNMAVDSTDKLTITIPTAGATAKDLKDFYDDSADSSVTDLVVITLASGSSGTGSVSTATEASLAAVTEFTLTESGDVASLTPYYDTTDQTYVMASGMFSQSLKPSKAYVFNGYESPAAAFATKIASFTNQDFYFLLMTSTTKSRQVEAATWADLNEKLLFVGSSDTTLEDSVSSNGYVAVLLQTTPGNHDESRLVGAYAPKNPGSITWAWKRATGITTETSSSLLTAASSGNVNVFKEISGITVLEDGKMTNGLFIDQRRSRDYIKARIKERMVALFAAEDKIPYDDSGIAQLVSVLADQLNAFGDQGIIAVVGTDSAAAEISYNGVYQFTINAPSRASVAASNPSWITNREYTITFTYVEAGAIHDLTVTGKVVLTLTS